MLLSMLLKADNYAEDSRVLSQSLMLDWHIYICMYFFFPVFSLCLRGDQWLPLRMDSFQISLQNFPSILRIPSLSNTLSIYSDTAPEWMYNRKHFNPLNNVHHQAWLSFIDEFSFGPSHMEINALVANPCQDDELFPTTLL